MPFLIFLDFFWSGAALWVDMPKLPGIPIWAWPAVVICPIYPILLALVWLKIYRKQKPNQYLLAYASIPSAIFGILALVYYPLLMAQSGFDWRNFGQIFWVLFYSGQGWWLILKYKFRKLPILGVCGYLTVKFILDYKFLTFGYLEVGDIAAENRVLLFSLALFLLAVLSIFVLVKKTKGPNG
jgi:hypothetical protein